MKKRLLVIFLLPLLVSVQSLATICTAECRLGEVFPEQTKGVSSELPSCHQSQNDEEPSSDEEDCGSKVCQLDELIKLDVFDLFPFEQVNPSLFHAVKIESKLKNLFLDQFLVTESPPGFYPYSNRSIFIQKSSYLI